MTFPPWLKVYGDLSFRLPRNQLPSEIDEQITVFNNLRRDYPQLAKIAMHVRNEGKKTPQAVMREKAEGMVSGAADIVIPARQTFVCELKKRDHTKSHWQPLQLEYLEACHHAGAFVCVALGYEAALEAIAEWNATRTI
jgi:hypothetical protein